MLPAMSTLDRLRRLHQARPQRTQREPEPLPPPPAPQQEQISAPAIVKPQRAGKLETLVPGEVIEK